MEISKVIFDVTESFPSHEKYSLKIQMERASISIPSNIAMGSSRTDKSFSHFLDISLDSSFELQTQILLEHYKKYISNESVVFLKLKIEEFQRATMSFQNTLNKQ